MLINYLMGTGLKSNKVLKTSGVKHSNPILYFVSGSMLSKTYGLEFLAINFVNIGEVFWKYLTHLMSSEMSFKMKINVIDVIGTDPEFKKVIQYYVRFDMPVSSGNMFSFSCVWFCMCYTL